MAHHTLSLKFFEGKHPTKIFYPSPSELHQFRQSEIGKYFHYIGRGWFYHFSNTKNNIKTNNEHTFEHLFSKCSIGDVRMRIGVYAPPNVSVFGWKRDSKVTVRQDIKGRKYGIMREGKYSVKELLDLSNGLFLNETGIKKIKSILSNQKLGFDHRFGFIVKEFFPFNVFAFLSALTLILLVSSSPIYFIINLLFLLDVNIYFRSAIWPNNYFSSDLFWTSLAILQLGVLLYIFFHERSTEVVCISAYSITIFIIFFQSKDFFHSDENPFILMNNKKNMFINWTNTV